LWSLAGGVLSCASQPGYPPQVRAKLEQKEAVTMVANVTLPPNQPLQAFIWIFIDGVGIGGPGRETGRSNVYTNFYQTGINVAYVAERTAREVDRVPVPPPSAEVELRLAYDPATGLARAWRDSQGGAEVAIPSKPAAGQSVAFTANTPGLKIRSLKVLRGVVPPADSGAALAAAPGETTVEFTNKDYVAATQVVLEVGGQAILTTAAGEVRCPAATVALITFGRKDTKDPAGRGDEARIAGPFGRLTLQFVRLSADELVGRSASLGEVHLRRSAIREVRFTSPAAK
jgi:hypothetical protein